MTELIVSSSMAMCRGLLVNKKIKGKGSKKTENKNNDNSKNNDNGNNNK